MQFQILGPLEVVGDDGEFRRLSSPTQRALLAVLLIHRNQVLSADQIVTEIWGDDEDRPEPKSLQFHISKLRDGLDPDRGRGSDGGVIRTRGSGYVLEASDDQVDSAAFENLIDDARAVDSAKPRERREMLGSALAMWRGRVFEGVPEVASAGVETRRLGELWLVAVEDRIDTDLALGRHATLVPELEALIQQHPLRERLHGQLMLALFRSDRQAESLRAFQTARGTLTDELGIEPSKALYELEAQILRQDPALDHVSAPPAPRGNIPARLSSFVGREEEMATLKQLVLQNRLVTLTGIGGVGKTRHALQIADDDEVQRPGGAWLAELGGLQDSSLVPQAVRSALDIPLLADGSVVDSLVDELRARDLLLVLDNCEHVVDAAATLVQSLLSSCPDLRVIATSREPLRVAGEVTWAVPPMRLPEDGHTSGSAEASECVDLFADRAMAANPAFELSEEDVATVGEICRQLDGLPLAIELAAARMRAFSVDELAERLDHRLSLLSGPVRSPLPHQGTLESTIAWSYALLTDEERAVFECAGVFAGSFSLNAFETVCLTAELAPSRVAVAVAELVDKSLLTVVRDGDDTRYRMLETLREYALLKLEKSAVEPEVKAAHTQWALAFAAEANGHLMGSERQVWLNRIYSSFDDLRAVLERSKDQGDPATGLRLLTAMEPFLVEIGDHEGFLTTTAVEDGASWLERLVIAGDVPAETLAPILSVRGFLLMLQGDDPTARSALERSIELFDTVDDDLGQARARLYLATAVWQEPPRARELLSSAIDTLGTMGPTCWQHWMALFLLNLWDLQHGDPADTATFARTLVELGEESGDAITKAHAAEVAGLRAHFGGSPKLARSELSAAVGDYRRAGFRVSCFAHCLDHVSLWTLEEGDPAHAAILLGSAEALRGDHVGAPAPAAELHWHDEAKLRTRKRLGEGDFERCFGQGLQTEPEQAGDLATAMLLPATS
ncbi:MAG: BTAD domain-containing putative transcriptional regulator [Acidimicrobiales bacterium]